MIITGTTAAAKIAVSPAIEYHAAITEMVMAEANIKYPNIIIVYS
jgi:hypothetical protein